MSSRALQFANMPGNKFIVSAPQAWDYTQPAPAPSGEDPVQQDPSLPSIEELVATNQRQRAFIEQLNTKIQQLQADKQSLAQKNLADSKEIASLRKDNRIYEEDYKIIYEKLQNSEREYHQVLQQLQEDKRSLEQKNLPDLQEMEKLRKYNLTHVEEYKKLHEKLQEKRRECNKLLAQSDRWQEEVNALQHRLNNFERSRK